MLCIKNQREIDKTFELDSLLRASIIDPINKFTIEQQEELKTCLDKPNLESAKNEMNMRKVLKIFQAYEKQIDLFDALFCKFGGNPELLILKIKELDAKK